MCRRIREGQQYGFGFEYKIPSIQNNDKIAIDMVSELPHPINKGKIPQKP
jgi:hypothetical protein